MEHRAIVREALLAGAPRDIIVAPEFVVALLDGLAKDPNGEIARVFDRELYPLALWFGQKRASHVAPRILRPTLRHDIYLPGVPSRDLMDVAQEAAITGLRRARRDAARYDPRRGDALAWVMCKVAFAYVDVVRKLVERAGLRYEPTDEPILHRIADAQTDLPPSRERILIANDVLNRLPPEERLVLMLRKAFMMTRYETAEQVYGDVTQVKLVDRVLARALDRIKQFDEEPISAPVARPPFRRTR